MEQAFVRSLSPTSRHNRFFGGLAELSDSILDNFIHMRYPTNVAIIATVINDDTEQEIGVARYAMVGEMTAEFAVAVADVWQGRGVATCLLQWLLSAAEQAGVVQMVGVVLRENRGMLALARQFGFVLRRDADDASIVRLS